MAELGKYDKNFIENWKRMRSRGRKNYTLTTGVIFAAVMFIVNRGFAAYKTSFSEAFFSTTSLVSLAIYFGISLVIFYFLAWPLNEKRYLRLTESSPSK